MKTKSRIIALVTVLSMLVAQVPFSVFAEDATTGTLTPATLEKGQVGRSYYQYFGFESDTYKSNDWSIDGNFPSGLTLTQNTTSDHPVISGVPTTAGSYTFKMQAKRNIDGEPTVVFEQSYTWVIDPADPLEITGGTTWYGYEVSSGDPYAFEHTCSINSAFEAVWSMEAVAGETLPEGLTIKASTGEITWASPKVGKYQMKVTATCNGETASKTLKLIVVPYDGCEHTGLEKVNGKAATCKANGTPDYWYCDACEGYYYDAECNNGIYRDVKTLYTTGFHEDTNDDGKCDTCGKTMPIFKKVTTDDEITSHGMYIVVSKIGEKYYTLKTPKKDYAESIEAVEIEQNADKTFAYPKANTGVMVLKTSAAVPCGGELDAGDMRYSFSTTVNGVPCVLDGGSGLSMYRYGDGSKYGFRIKLTEGGNADIADVYSAYWGSGDGGKGGGSILSAYEKTVGDATERYFSFTTGETASPVALYKLAYIGGTESGQSYTVSDASLTASQAAVNNTLIDFENNKFSVVGGISDALTNGAVEDIIDDEGLTATELTVQTYASINAESKETAEGSTGDITAITYEVTPYIEIKDADGSSLLKQPVPNAALNGAKMTVTLCVGSMNPKQIIHYKGDGTEEYFYAESSDEVKNGAKSFKLNEDSVNGNLVIFEIDSFSKIKILATAEPEKPKSTVTSRGGGGGTATYIVKFETNGGSAINSVKVDKNKNLSEPTVPTKDGFEFAGWYTDKALTTAYDFSAKATKGMTLYAAWMENKDEVKDDAAEPTTPESTVAFVDVKDGDWFADSVKYVTENGLMNGTTATEFAPNDNLTRAMLVTILYRAAGEPETNKSIPFADVKAGSYYASAVIWAQQNGIVSGVNENEFAPDENITREQIAAIIYRYAKFKGYDVSVGENTNILSYADAEDISEYAVSAVQYAVGSGLMKGKTESTLNPKDFATRAEIATILQRFIEGNK